MGTNFWGTRYLAAATPSSRAAASALLPALVRGRPVNRRNRLLIEPEIDGQLSAVMGQVRAALRALALTTPEPPAVLAGLDRLVG